MYKITISELEQIKKILTQSQDLLCECSNLMISDEFF
jgi:hypothetical protein